MKEIELLHENVRMRDDIIRRQHKEIERLRQDNAKLKAVIGAATRAQQNALHILTDTLEKKR